MSAADAEDQSASGPEAGATEELFAPRTRSGRPARSPDRTLLIDAIDMHAHSHPALFRRPIDDRDLILHAIDYGMRGIVLKDHDSSTTGRAYHTNQVYTEAQAFGGIVCNRSVGGINPYVVQAALHYGASVIWMPSNHSRWHAEYFNMPDYPQLGRPAKQLPGPGVTVFDENDQLTPEALTVLDLVADAGVCLATGHLSLAEIRALQDEAIRRGVEKFLVTHANWSLCKLSVEDQRELVAKGAYLEYVAISCASATFWEQNPEQLAQWIRELGGDRLVLSSDLGQASGPPHPEAIRMVLSALLDYGAPYDELEKMTKANPAVLLGLNPLDAAQEVTASSSSATSSASSSASKTCSSSGRSITSGGAMNSDVCSPLVAIATPRASARADTREASGSVS